MNIFFIDVDPQACAESHFDKHVIKMILEYSQILCTTHRVLDEARDPALYKATHVNHPSTKWARTSKAHYRWLFELFEACCAEYTRRYGKIHATQRRLLEILRTPPANLPDRGWTNPPCAMPDEYKTGNCVASYRTYYLSKQSFASWKAPAACPHCDDPWFDVDIKSHLKGRLLHGMKFDVPDGDGAYASASVCLDSAPAVKMSRNDMRSENALGRYSLVDAWDLHAADHSTTLRMFPEDVEEVTEVETQWQEDPGSVVEVWDGEVDDVRTMHRAVKVAYEKTRYRLPATNVFSITLTVSPNDREVSSVSYTPFVQIIRVVPGVDDVEWVHVNRDANVLGLWKTYTRPTRPLTQVGRPLPRDLLKALRGKEPVEIAVRNVIRTHDGWIGLMYDYGATVVPHATEWRARALAGVGAIRDQLDRLATVNATNFPRPEESVSFRASLDDAIALALVRGEIQLIHERLDCIEKCVR